VLGEDPAKPLIGPVLPIF